jgi:hypothetical protein
MARPEYLLVAVCVVVVLGFGAAAEPEKEKPKDPKRLIADRLYFGAEFELTLTAPDTDERFQRTREATVFDELVINNCFALEGRGAMTAVVKFTKTGEEFTLRSYGPAEDIYAIQTYQFEKTFPKHFKKLKDATKESPDLKVGRSDRPDKSKEIDPIPRALLPVVLTAAQKYEEKRPEMMFRVKKDSVLFLPRAEKAHWSVYRDGDRLFLTTFCVDKLYSASFQVEFKKTDARDGDWEYVRVYGLEEFKGE